MQGTTERTTRRGGNLGRKRAIERLRRCIPGASEGRLQVVAETGGDLGLADKLTRVSLPVRVAYAAPDRTQRPHFAIKEHHLTGRHGLVLLICADPDQNGDGWVEAAWVMSYSAYYDLARPAGFQPRVSREDAPDDDWTEYRRHGERHLLRSLTGFFDSQSSGPQSPSPETSRGVPGRHDAKGKWQTEYMLPPSGDGDSHEDRVAQELSYRTSLWEKIGGAGDRATVAADVLRDLRIYGGQQGIFRDSSRTERLTDGRPGVAVSVLHTGRSYADDLGEIELLYHYPKTNRPAAHDQGEIEATKVAARLRLPVFVILPSATGSAEREVRLGWVENWDDESELFLISFGETPPATLSDEVREETPFRLLDTAPGGETTARTRPGQQRFKFEVFKRYGSQCAVCGVAVPEVLDAVHIRPKGENGSDDPRNGLVLCASHHRAFDAGLFVIHPETTAITCTHGGPDPDELKLGFTDLLHLREHPHVEALKWQWGRWSGQ